MNIYVDCIKGKQKKNTQRKVLQETLYFLKLCTLTFVNPIMLVLSEKKGILSHYCVGQVTSIT